MIKGNELKYLSLIIDSLNLTSVHRILDVGCGYGGKMKLLLEKKLDVLGIEVNPSILKANLDNGLPCLNSEQFDKTTGQYDLLIMSHIIEHFSSRDLLFFVDHYLDRLKVGGHIIFVTPLMSRVFFDDFDHIRPYPPSAINEMFVVDNPQSQYFSKYSLELLTIRLRKRRIQLSSAHNFYLRATWPRFQRALTTVFIKLYEWSGGIVGQTDGWLGLYKNKGLRRCEKDRLRV